eukprot:Nitzschia sp. Nitz4//scaffold21_size171442//78450//79621//NITZ4_002164-RA/size171442-augustus-gene-0.183-mRNA-1//1//CDS//3329542420//5104//frame0
MNRPIRMEPVNVRGTRRVAFQYPLNYRKPLLTTTFVFATLVTKSKPKAMVGTTTAAPTTTPTSVPESSNLPASSTATIGNSSTPGPPLNADVKGGEPNTEAANSNSVANASRLSNTTAFLPIVYGSVAFYLGKKADEFQTHEWTLYLRGPNNEDLSSAISKVVFQLHASFAQPIREYTQPPFEVTERGWGEFEAQIRIIWRDPNEKPTLMNHGIKLYPPGAAPNTMPIIDPNSTTPPEPVVAEVYDEVVFTDPSEHFFRQLINVSNAPRIESSQHKYLTQRYDDQADSALLVAAAQFLKEELVKAKQRFLLVNQEFESVSRALEEAQKKHQQEVSQSRKNKSSAQRKPRPSAQNKKAKPS